MKLEWANSDSRLIIERDTPWTLGDGISITAVYEADTDVTHEATVVIPLRDFRNLLKQAALFAERVS